MDYTVVIPTTGRDSLSVLLSAVDGGIGPAPAEIIVVDDRRSGPPLWLPTLDTPVRLAHTGGRGPAAARNAGWQLAGSEWVAFLDDDVLTGPGWRAELATDLTDLPAEVAASQGRIIVPSPSDGRKWTDAERGTAALASASWITADMAYRRAALTELGGFDERFRRAYREDSDLALRVLAAGYRITRGSRGTVHPARRGGMFTSVSAQAGNADDALMRHKHGAGWRRRAGERPGMLARHASTTLLGAAAVALAATAPTRRLALGCAAGWAALTAGFAGRRIRPGPRDPAEVARMLVSSVLIPPFAVAHRLAGERRARRQPAAVLFDRDDTLIEDVPYLADPAKVRPVGSAATALRRLRAAGVPVGVVTNQSGVARGLISAETLAAVNARVDELLGPLDTWQVCVHGEHDGCRCRKPAPGLIERAADALGVAPRRCVVIGDTDADLAAASAAGARGILVPTGNTRPAEVRWARARGRLARTVADAVDLAFGRTP